MAETRAQARVALHHLEAAIPASHRVPHFVKEHILAGTGHLLPSPGREPKPFTIVAFELVRSVGPAVGRRRDLPAQD
ncbi:MAG: hypothetical protein WA688_05185, partial [Thermoplasmata archaeon]